MRQYAPTPIPSPASREGRFSLLPPNLFGKQGMGSASAIGWAGVVTVQRCGNLLFSGAVIKSMDNLAQFSKEELIAIIAQQAEMIGFLQQQVVALQKEIETLKRGGKGTPLSKPPPPELGQTQHRALRNRRGQRA